MSADYLYTTCDTLLDVALDAVSEQRTGRPPPDRVFVSHGPTEAQGCPNGQLTVHHEPIRLQYSRQQTASSMPKGGPVVPQMEAVVRLFRCVRQLEDDGNVPTAEFEDEQAARLMVDGWALATGVWASVQGNAFSRCNGVKLGNLVPLRSQGTYAGWALSVTFGLSDSGPE